MVLADFSDRFPVGSVHRPGGTLDGNMPCLFKSLYEQCSQPLRRRGIFRGLQVVIGNAFITNGAVTDNDIANPYSRLESSSGANADKRAYPQSNELFQKSGDCGSPNPKTTADTNHPLRTLYQAEFIRNTFDTSGFFLSRNRLNKPVLDAEN